MDTAKAGAIMAKVAQRLKHPDWIALGRVIAAIVREHPDGDVETLADQVAERWERGNE